MNYKSLTTPLNTTTEKTLLGQKVFIRRLTNTELDNYNDAVDAARIAGQTSRQLSILGASLFLQALVNEDGSRPGKKDLPTAEELLDAHASADLLQAITTVQRYSYGTPEEAEKN